VAGCGGGDKSTGTGASVPTAVQTASQGVTAPPSTQAAPAQPAKPPATTTSPQATPGGAGGGTEPARTELTFTATSGGIEPRKAGVAPYVAVKVTLRSKDGSAHTLTVGGKTLKVGGTRVSAFATLPGLRPGAAYTGRADGGRTVRILSTAEPGP
jgi:hypothetical protein